MAAFYLKSGAGAAEFVQSNAYSLGNKIVPKRADAGSNYAVARKWVWECTTAGTSAAAEPTWPASVTQDVTTVTSGTATFTARKPGFSSGSTANWAFAGIYLDYVITAPTAVGDVVYVSNNHAESVNGAISAIAVVAGVSVICVDDAATPPTTVATTATVTTTGNNNLSLGAAGREYFYGITFTAGGGASGAAAVLLNFVMLENCNVVIGTTGSAYIGNNSFTLINCGVKFSAVGQSILAPANGVVYVLGGSLLSGGTSPTVLVGAVGGFLMVDGFDLSNAAAGVYVLNLSSFAIPILRNIKLPASWSGSVNAASHTAAGGLSTLFNCDNAATSYLLSSKSGKGTTAHETTIVKTGGFAVGGTPISWKVVSLAACGPAGCYINQHVTPELAAYNSTVGSAITVTVDILRDSLTNLQNNEIWLEVTYLGTSGAPLGTYVSSRPATPLTAASDCAASSATWTTTGLTNPNEQKLTVTFTPQLAGMIIGRVKLCKASATVYVDPVLQIS